jgi:glutamate-5-semialdehyde dehydrogenase
MYVIVKHFYIKGGNDMTDLADMGQRAQKAKFILQKAAAEQKNKALLCAAELLISKKAEIINANAEDVRTGEQNGMHPGMIDRLKADENRIKAMADGLKQIAELPDCIGEVMEEFERPNGLLIQKKRVPLGVIGIIYESRPNVTVDAFGLCFKSGNAVILKGGSDAIKSNIAIAGILREALIKCGFSGDEILLIEDTDRSVTMQLMKMKEYVDVLIPRGGASLIRNVVENSTIPVIETGTGNCHVYVDKYADTDMAVEIIFNAKTQRIGVCNACESLVVHSAISDELLPKLAARLKTKNVELRADERAMNVLKGECVPALEEDYGREYLDYILSIKTVDSVDEAIEHINRYNTGHSDCIVTENTENAEKFLNEVDAACVYVNASTRFTDGFEFGFGAEIGIRDLKR